MQPLPLSYRNVVDKSNLVKSIGIDLGNSVDGLLSPVSHVHLCWARQGGVQKETQLPPVLGELPIS